MKSKSDDQFKKSTIPFSVALSRRSADDSLQ